MQRQRREPSSHKGPAFVGLSREEEILHEGRRWYWEPDDHTGKDIYLPTSHAYANLHDFPETIWIEPVCHACHSRDMNDGPCWCESNVFEPCPLCGKSPMPYRRQK